MNKEHYNFSYENGEDFQAFPTIAVVLAHRGSIEDMSIPGVPEFNPMMLLHGEEKVEVYKPIERDTILVCQEKVVDLQDKKKAFVMVIETSIKEKETGELKAKIITNLFVRSKGGFGRKGEIKNIIPEAPKDRAADHSSVETTTPNQAFIYRLCGDRNPLHVDP